MKNTGNRLRRELQKNITEAIKDVVLSCNELWVELDELIDKELENTTCSLSFHDGVINLHVFDKEGFGTWNLHPKLEIDVECYPSIKKLSKVHKKEIEDQLQGIETLLIQLGMAQNKLAWALQR